VTYLYKFEFSCWKELFDSLSRPESLSFPKIALSPSAMEISESQTDLRGRYEIILDVSRVPTLCLVLMNLEGLAGCSSLMLDWKPTLRVC